MSTTSAMAGERVQGKVRDHYTTAYESIPVTKQYCNIVDVPIYETRRRSGNAAEGALLGMIIGGISGKAITGDDGGAAAGAIMGGVIGADKGGRDKTEQVITGYRKERQCEDVTEYENHPKKVYSHSTLVFTLDGKRYKLDFTK
jgi:uncharacterized protein YcfJ